MKKFILLFVAICSGLMTSAQSMGDSVIKIYFSFPILERA